MSATSCAKRCLLVLELFSALCALVLVAFGVYVLSAYDADEVASAAAYAYTAVGVATLVIVFFGCIGTVRESVCCTTTFIILLVILIIAQSAVVFVLTRGRNAVASNLANALDLTWEDELDSPGAMRHYEEWFHCCGRASPQDYIVNGRLPPPSCFKDGDDSLPTNLIARGCRLQFEDYCGTLLLAFNIVAWILIGVEFTGIIVSCVLCNSIRNERRRSYF